jgi:hypothetical protein
LWDGRPARPTITIKIVSYLIRDPKLERKRKRKQKKLAQKTDKISNKRRKAKLLVAKVSSKVARVREDFLARAISQDSIRKPSYLCRKFGS